MGLVMRVIDFSKLTIFIGLAWSGIAAADQISVPNEFVSGTVASASAVNENFSVLADESNVQDKRIAAIETVSSTAVVSEQLVCAAFNHIVSRDFQTRIANPRRCVSSSSPMTVSSLSYQQVVADGWTLALVSPEVWVFNR